MVTYIFHVGKNGSKGRDGSRRQKLRSRAALRDVVRVKQGSRLESRLKRQKMEVVSAGS